MFCDTSLYTEITSIRKCHRTKNFLFCDHFCSPFLDWMIFYNFFWWKLLYWQCKHIYQVQNWPNHTYHGENHNFPKIIIQKSSKIVFKKNFSFKSNKRSPKKPWFFDCGQTGQGGGVTGLVVIVLWLLFSNLQTYFCGSKKPENIYLFTLNTMYHMFVNVFFDPVDLTSHFIKFRICLPVSFCFYAQNKQTF